MKLSTKTALVSGVVFPGAGYFLVKKKWQGIITTAIVVLCIFVLVSEATYKAKIIAEKILNGSLPFDIILIKNEIVTIPGQYSAETISLITTILIATWIISIIDGYRIGRKIEQNEILK